MDVTGIEPVTPLLANQRGCVTVIWNQNLRLVRPPLFGAIRAVSEHFRYDLCTNTWRHAMKSGSLCSAGASV